MSSSEDLYIPCPEGISLLEYITCFMPSVRNCDNGDVFVEAEDDVKFLWDGVKTVTSQELDARPMHPVEYDYEVNHDFALPEAKNSRLWDYPTIDRSFNEKKYGLCIFPRNDVEKVTWQRIIASTHINLEIVMVDEWAWNNKQETYTLPCEDKRGLPVDHTLEIIRQSQMVVAPPSGITALAAYCGTMFLTYGTTERNPWKANPSYNPHRNFGLSFRGTPTSKQLSDACLPYLVTEHGFYVDEEEEETTYNPSEE